MCRAISCNENKNRHRERVREQCELCILGMARKKHLVREGFKKLKPLTPRKVRTLFCFAYLQHGDEIIGFPKTLNGILQIVASGGLACNTRSHSFLIKELERTKLLNGSKCSSASYLGPAVNRQPGYRRVNSQICASIIIVPTQSPYDVINPGFCPSIYQCDDHPM